MIFNKNNIEKVIKKITKLSNKIPQILCIILACTFVFSMVEITVTNTSIASENETINYSELESESVSLICSPYYNEMLGIKSPMQYINLDIEEETSVAETEEIVETESSKDIESLSTLDTEEYVTVNDKLESSEVELTEIETETIEIIEETTVENIPKYTFTQEELNVLYRIVECECHFSKDNTMSQYRIVHVILNRLNSDQFPNSIIDVIYQSGQFTPVSTGIIDTVEVQQGTIDNVNYALSIDDITYGSLYFCTQIHWFDWAEYVFTDSLGIQFFR